MSQTRLIERWDHPDPEAVLVGRDLSYDFWAKIYEGEVVFDYTSPSTIPTLSHWRKFLDDEDREEGYTPWTEAYRCATEWFKTHHKL